MVCVGSKEMPECDLIQLARAVSKHTSMAICVFQLHIMCFTLHLRSCPRCLPQHGYDEARFHSGFGVQSCRSAIHHCAELSVGLSWGLL